MPRSCGGRGEESSELSNTRNVCTLHEPFLKSASREESRSEARAPFRSDGLQTAPSESLRWKRGGAKKIMRASIKSMK